MPPRPAGTLLVLLAALLLTACAAPKLDTPSPIRPKEGENPRTFPSVVLYSVSWCPHCREAKEYLASNNIPFINRDVELDPAAMEDLTQKYKSQGVPVIVIGNDEKVLKGFDRVKFENAVKAMQEKK